METLMPNVIDKIYLPFTVRNLRQHFISDVDAQLDYFTKSASRYHQFLTKHPVTTGISLTKAKTFRQIEKDERFWTVTTLKNIFDDPSRERILAQLLSKTYGSSPPISGLSTWEECLNGDLHLYFEACLPSPQSYVKWLRSNLSHRQMVPYVLDAAARKNARTLEGATHVDAMFLNLTNGFAWLIEAKVLSDISYLVSFDNFRNQIIRNIDVMLENNSSLGAGLEKRDPERSLFGLLTPACFRDLTQSRLYGWLMRDYRSKPSSLARDLCHRPTVDWPQISRRMGWFTFEECEKMKPGSCPWL